MTAREMSVSSSVGRNNSALDVDEEMGNTNISCKKDDIDSSPGENKDPPLASKDDDFPVNSSSSDQLEKDLDAVSLDVHGQ